MICSDTSGLTTVPVCLLRLCVGSPTGLEVTPTWPSKRRPWQLFMTEIDC